MNSEVRKKFKKMSINLKWGKMVLRTREVREKVNVNESLKKENVKTCRKKMKEDGKL